MKAAPFEYVRAKDAEHAVELLVAAEGFAKPIAGGQSLGPMLNLRLVEPDLLVDVRNCPDLRSCRDDGETIVYGAAVTHSEIEDGAIPDPCHGWRAAVARRIAYRAVRNRGTLGGSIAHADPAARTGSSSCSCSARRSSYSVREECALRRSRSSSPVRSRRRSAPARFLPRFGSPGVRVGCVTDIARWP